MATRHLTWPQTLAPMMGTLGFNRVHNSSRTTTLGGVSYARDYWRRGKEQYEAVFRPRQESSVEMEVTMDITERLHGVVVPIWIPEPLERFHRRRLCGVGDGTTKAFPVQFWEQASAPHIMIGPAEQTVAEWSQRANLLSDDQAAQLESKTGLLAYGTGVSVTWDDAQSYFGRYSAKVHPTLSAANWGLSTSIITGLSAGVVYTGVMWVAGTIPSARAYIRWRDGASTISVSYGTSTALGDGWTAIYVTDTAPVGTVEANLGSECDVTSTEDYWASCLSLGPLESPDWWLPSLCPGVARLSTAPAADDRVESTGSGRSIIPCAAEKNVIGRTVDAIGNVTIPRITFEEIWQYG